MVKGNDMNSWKTIDTIPKDGTNVLLWDGEKFAVGNQPPDCKLGRWSKDKNGNWTGSTFMHHFKPTHWIELPDPPTMRF